MAKFTFKLERPARKSGGDRYECEQDENWKVYFPQKISRFAQTDPVDQPVAKLIMELTYE